MKTSWIRIAIALLAVLSIGISTIGTAWAQAEDIELVSDEMPDGVAFETLAIGEGSQFRFHIDAMYLHHISIDCGQATGKLFGKEQITFVDYGQVDVRDWESGDVIATLSAGDAFGPTADETSFFLASPKGRNGSVYHFSGGGRGEIGDELPEVIYETLPCGSGPANPTPVEPAEVTTLFANDQAVDTMPGTTSTLYVGLLTVEPGASIGQPYATGVDVISYTASGSGVILPLVGGFGDGQVTMSRLATGPEVGPGEIAWTHPSGLVALENFGAITTTALLFGAVPAGDPIFVEREGTGGYGFGRGALS